MLRTFMLAGLAAAALAALPLMMEGGPQFQPQPQPAAPAAVRPMAAPAPSGRKARIRADAAGHFSAEFRFNGRVVPAMIDTGATVVALNRTTARRIGLDVAESDFTGLAETANGRVRTAPVVIDRIVLGRIGLRAVPAVVIDDRALSGTLVGMSFLSRLKRFSLEGGALALEQ